MQVSTSTPEKSSRRLRSVLTFFLLFALSSAFCLPLLKQLTLSCRGDWDYFSFVYEIQSISLFEYHQFPLWNPYSGGGMPLFGNPQTGLPSLTFLAASLFGVVAGLKISVWIHTFLGLWGMWLLGGHLGIQGPSRLLPPLIFICSGPWALHLAEGHIIWLPAAFLPFFFMAFLKGYDDARWFLGAAVVESLMFYEGATYVLAFSILFVAVYAACSSFDLKSWKPVPAFMAVNALAAALSAPKLLPVLDLLGSHPRPAGAIEVMSWDNFLFLFIERMVRLGANMWELGSYVGITVVVLYLLSLSLFTKQRALVTSSLFMMLVSLGNFGPYSPWQLLHALPVFSGFQVPTRALIVVCFSVALLVGLYLEKVESAPDKHPIFLVGLITVCFLEFSPWKIVQGISFASGFRNPTPGLFLICTACAILVGLSLRQNRYPGHGRISYLVGAVVVFIGIDLCLVNSQIFTEAAKPVDVIASAKIFNPAAAKFPPAKLYNTSSTDTTGLLRSIPSVHQPFSQVRIPGLERFVHGAWSDQYLSLLQNRGVVDAYETIPFDHFARAVNDANYRGEYFVLGKGKADLVGWSPNRFVYHVTLRDKDRLVINQNFWPGWKTSRGVLARHEGLLAVDLPPGDYDVAVRYLPRSFLIGILIFLISVAGIITAFRVMGEKPATGLSTPEPGSTESSRD